MNKIGVWGVVALAVLLCSAAECRASVPQPTPKEVSFSLYFRQGGDLLMKNYRGNDVILGEMGKLMTPENIARISKISIIGATSPEGCIEVNEQLALKRAESVRSYIHWRWGTINRQAIKIVGHCDNLPAWIQAVENDPKMPRKDKVLEILRSDLSMPTKWANIQLLLGGVSSHMEKNIFPKLRNAVACVVEFEQAGAAGSVAEPHCGAEAQAVAVNAAATATRPEAAAFASGAVTAGEPVCPLQKGGAANKPLFAVKTNLLFDAATILNLEAEVPLGRRFSVGAELIFPWWLWESQQHCVQVFSGTVEGRYWFGDRTRRAVLTGWFAGVHVGGGYYDLEWNRKGYQGEFFLAAGVSGGYAHTINKKGTLRMEYSLGVGYLSTDYRSYEAKFSNLDNAWHLYRQETGRFSWIGPTRAKVSLVWLLDTNLFKKKGGRK